MDAMTLAIGAMIFAIGYFAGRLSSGLSSGHSGSAPADVPTLIASLTDDERTRVMASLAAQRKLEAIKIFREATQAGLRDAKHAVERMAKGVAD